MSETVEIVGLEIQKYVEERKGYLYFGSADICNIYQNRKISSPYSVSLVFKEGYDSVAILLYYISDKQIYVGTIENLRPVLYMRKCFTLPKRDTKEYLFFRGIIAGALEKLGGEGDAYINKRAAEEIMEESGFHADPSKMIDLGSYFTSPGYCLEKMYLKAYKLENFDQTKSHQPNPFFEEGIRFTFIKVCDVLSMYSDGTFEDPKTEIAIRRLCSKLGYIPELDVWYEDLDSHLKQKFRHLFS